MTYIDLVHFRSHTTVFVWLFFSLVLLLLPIRCRIGNFTNVTGERKFQIKFLIQTSIISLIRDLPLASFRQVLPDLIIRALLCSQSTTKLTNWCKCRMNYSIKVKCFFIFGIISLSSVKSRQTVWYTLKLDPVASFHFIKLT